MKSQVIAWAIAQGISIPHNETSNWRLLPDADHYSHPLFGQVKSGITDGLTGYVETVNYFEGRSTAGTVFHVTIGQMDKSAPIQTEEEEEV